MLHQEILEDPSLSSLISFVLSLRKIGMAAEYTAEAQYHTGAVDVGMPQNNVVVIGQDEIAVMQQRRDNPGVLLVGQLPLDLPHRF
jgi:hypothetical protein